LKVFSGWSLELEPEVGETWLVAARGRSAAGTKARIENRNILFNLKLS
jgi:hypothetical protein